jgi:hypothetical protein
MKAFTKEMLAAKLNKRQCGNELTTEEEQLAADNNLVVIFGASDDLIELRGAIYNEFYIGDQILITKEGLLKSECPCADRDDVCPYFEEIRDDRVNNKTVVEVKAYWDGEHVSFDYFQSIGMPNWCFICEGLNVGEATFDIFDNDTYYCRGIVIDLDELPLPDSYLPEYLGEILNVMFTSELRQYSDDRRKHALYDIDRCHMPPLDCNLITKQLFIDVAERFRKFIQKK